MLRVADIMTPNPRTVEPTNSVGTALRIMQEGGFHHLPVVQGEHLVGIVHAHDIRRSLGWVTLPERVEFTPEMWDAVPLAHVMRPVDVTATPDTPVAHIVEVMTKRLVTGIPVVEGQRLVGIVTVRDVLDLTARLIDRFAEQRIPPAVCFVGRAKSGKTTLIERLIPELRARGYRVGVLKHHFHPTLVDQEGKDTWRYERVGASPVVIVSAVQTAAFHQTEKEPPMDVVLAEHFSGVDIVLVEGYRWADKPRIEVHRSARSEHLLCPAEDIIALVSDKQWDVSCPQFDLDDIESIANFVEQRFLKSQSPEA